jgi:DNA-binding MarR family transcriptional regulator
VNDSRREPLLAPTDVIALADRTLDIVPRAMRRIRTAVRESGEPKLSVAQLRTLLYVRRHPGVGLSAVAEHLGLSRPAASMQVDRLVRAGLVDRSDDPDERRRIQLRLTGSGAEEVGRAHLAVRAWLAAELDTLEATDVEALDAGLRVLELIAAEAPS